MILAWMIIILMAAAILSWLVARFSETLAKWISLLAVVADILIIASLWLQHTSTGILSNNLLIDFRAPWINVMGIGFHLSLDGLSIVMLSLTFLIGALSVLCSWDEIKERTGFYYFNLLFTLAGITGVFLAMDMFLFYFFWEVMLVPMFFLILLWGGERRKYAAYKFFLFTQAGGLLMLLSILALFFIHGRQTGNYSYDYFELINTNLTLATSGLLMSGFLVAFAVKLPVVPLHNWLPDAHGEAPTAGSLILAGLLLKTGAYGIIRFVVPMFPAAAASIANWAMLFGVIGILYGAVLAYGQTDLKRLIAYTSVSHMGFILLGVFSYSELAMQGVVLQMLAHGLSTGALFVVAGMLKERLHTRDIEKMGGLWKAMPSLGGVAMVFTMASLGLPAMGNFIAEFLILLGAFNANPVLTAIACVGLVLAALYSLRFMQKVFFGPQTTVYGPVSDLNFREAILMTVLVAGIILLGIYPQPVINMAQEVIAKVMSG